MVVLWSSGAELVSKVLLVLVVCRLVGAAVVTSVGWERVRVFISEGVVVSQDKAHGIEIVVFVGYRYYC